MTTTDETTPVMSVEQDAEWLAWRKGGITASDVARCHTGRYGGSPMAIVAEKLGIAEPTEVTDAMTRGLRLEVPITAAVANLRGTHVGYTQAWLQHADRPTHRATIDGVLLPHADAEIGEMLGIVEIKTVGQHVPSPWDYYEVQTQWQMHVADADVALVAVAVVSDEDEPDEIVSLKFKTIKRDDQLIATLVELADTLWSWVERGEVPPPSAPGDLEVVKYLTREHDSDADTVNLDGHLSLIVRRAELAERKDEVEAELDTINATLVAAIGSATRGTAPGFTVSYSVPRRVLTADGEREVLRLRPDLAVARLDRAAAKADKAAAELIKRHQEPVGARVLAVRTKKAS